MTDLKPCPFCGSEAKFRHIFENPDKCMVGCRGCDVVIDGVFPNELEAAKEWNDQKVADALAAMTAERDAARSTISALESDLINATMNLEHTAEEKDAANKRAEAAVEDMRIMRTCQICKHMPDNYPSLHGACADCDDEDKWEWRVWPRKPTDAEREAEGWG